MHILHTRSRFGGCLTAILVLFTRCALARGDEVDDFVEAQRQWQHIPGLSLTVVRSNEIVKAKGYGLMNVETGTPVTPETVFKLGSLSKQFIATAIMVLVQDGKVALNDPVTKYLHGMPDTWSGITIQHLLSHTSGLLREVPDFDPFKPLSDAEVLKLVTPLPLRSAPGERWEYSNVGYYALAEVIRTVSGKAWSEFIRERLFDPLAMRATRTTTSAIVPQRASGYFGKGQELFNAPEWPVVRPSGAFLSTALDLAKWDMALSSGKILTPASRDRMWTPVALKDGALAPYGFGWFVDAVNGHRRVHHDGGLPGFSCDYERFSEGKLTVIVLANMEGRDLRDFAVRIASFYESALLPPIEKNIPDTEPQVTDRIKAVLASITNGTLDTNLFTTQLASTLTLEVNAGFGNNLQKLGSIPSLDLLERKIDGGERSYRYRLNYKNVPLFIRCTFNTENKISKLAIFD